MLRSSRTGVLAFRCVALILWLVLLSVSCNRRDRIQRTERTQTSPDSGIRVKSVDFYSEALQKPGHYLVALPPDYDAKPSTRFSVLFLLHGMNGNSADWIQKGNILQFLVSHHLVAVMPDASDSYYTNASLRPRDRYEDFIADDLVRDVEQHYRVISNARGRGLGGISMGGYGAIKIALRHPDEFAFAAGISPAVDATRRRFAPRRIGQSFRYLRIFGLESRADRRANDVFVLAQQHQTSPYLFLACGTDEALLGVNRSFAALLEKRGFPYEYHEARGGHSWDFWKSEIPEMLNSTETHLQPQ